MIKRIIKRVAPILMALVIVSGTVFTNLQVAHATGVEPIMYYTYWDLISTLYATCGYETTVDENVVNNHGVTGKQVWGNFCTWVELHVKAHNELVLKPAVEELKNLVNTATDKGVSLSQDLYDLLKECFAEQVATGTGNDFVVTDSKQYNKMIQALTGCSDYADASSLGYSNIAGAIISGSALLSVVKEKIGYEIIACYPDALFTDFDSEGHVYTKGNWRAWSGGGDVISSVEKRIYIDMNAGYFDSPEWVIKNGKFVFTDTVGAQVSAGACPKEVPDVSPWIKNPAIPDEWRIVQPGETPDPDDDPDEQPEIIPAVIPIQPHLPDKEPDNTEDPDSTENPGENPDKDKDKDKTPLVNPIINPDTGNVVDPETGWDIDPETGWLINPDTGELVDPDSVHKSTNVVDSAGKFGDITTLFPFCIPFDLVKLIKGMKAKKAPPAFHFEYYFKAIDYNFVIDVDLTDYDKYVKIFRYGMQVFYIIALMFMTARMSELFS